MPEADDADKYRADERDGPSCRDLPCGREVRKERLR